MTPIFVDAGYWIALFSPSDELHARAKSLSRRLAGGSLVTSELVLVEVLDGFAPRGERSRRAAVEAVRAILADDRIEVATNTRNLFESSLALYADRLDKDWSLTDCASMVIMRERGIPEVLSADHHFRQAGFTTLLD
jgi:uncharacterized protein